MKIAIIGAGPAGLMCAIQAGKNINNEILLIDSNEKIGKKLFITGKGRCNVCNSCTSEEFLTKVVTNPKFLYSSINKFSPKDTYEFFEKNGVKLKVERGSRVFPQSDKSSDIIKGLTSQINKNNTKILLNTKVVDIIKKENGFLIKTTTTEISCNCVVICTGGKSYSSTGSCGDGYKFAKKLGHNIVDIKPALVPIRLKNYNGSLAGLTLKNISIETTIDNKSFSFFGEMLFTHNGISGPIVLTLSSYINKLNISNVPISINLKPALNKQVLNERLIKDFLTFKNKSLKNYLKELLPSSLIDYFISCINLDANKRVCDITKEEREIIINSLLNLTFTMDKLDNIDYAIVTSGGVSVKEVNPANMESKICKNLFFAGEVLDVDCLTGGFNIQTALSTGYSAGTYLNKMEGK